MSKMALPQALGSLNVLSIINVVVHHAARRYNPDQQLTTLRKVTLLQA